MTGGVLSLLLGSPRTTPAPATSSTPLGKRNRGVVPAPGTGNSRIWFAGPGRYHSAGHLAAAWQQQRTVSELVPQVPLPQCLLVGRADQIRSGYCFQQQQV
jgi:hypothetical protein